jgi:hypothetical protein
MTDRNPHLPKHMVRCTRCGDGVRQKKYLVSFLDRRTDSTVAQREHSVCEECFQETKRFLGEPELTQVVRG